MKMAMMVAMMMVCGCGTMTRCMKIEAEQVFIAIYLNDPETIAENAYPRSISILSQEQMVEGGSDTIASGNSTPIAPLSGDKALDTIGTLGASALVPGAGAVKVLK
jgi:hypothetical protein